MRTEFKVIGKVIVHEFYREHAGFFLLVIGIGFGFMGGAEHRALALYFSASAGTALIPVGLWALYAFQISMFNSVACMKSENGVLYIFSLAPKSVQWPVLTGIVVQQFLPALAYGLFLLATAFSSARYSSFMIMTAGLLLLCVAMVLHLSKLLSTPSRERKAGRLQEYLQRKFVKPFPLFFVLWLARRQPLTLLGVKIFSCFLLAGVAVLYRYDSFDGRLLLMGCTVGFSTNLIIVFEYHLFENMSLQSWRALPISLWRRVALFCLTFATLLWPEIVVLIKFFPPSIPFPQVVVFILYGFSLCFSAYAFLFRKQTTLELFVRMILAETLVSIALILFQVPPGLLSLALVIAGAYWYRKFYYRFEFRAVS